MIGHDRRVNDFAGIEHVARIPDLFQSFQHLVVFDANHRLQELAAQTAIAMFAAQRSTKPFYNLRNIFCDSAKGLHALLGLQIDNRSQMQLASPGMPVVHTLGVVFRFQQRADFRNKLGQHFQPYCCVFNQSHRLGIPHDIGNHAQAGLSQTPDFLDVIAKQKRHVISEACGLQFRLNLACDGLNL